MGVVVIAVDSAYCICEVAYNKEWLVWYWHSYECWHWQDAGFRGWSHGEGIAQWRVTNAMSSKTKLPSSHTVPKLQTLEKPGYGWPSDPAIAMQIMSLSYQWRRTPSNEAQGVSLHYYMYVVNVMNSFQSLHVQSRTIP